MKLLKYVAGLAVAVALTACGGGGGNPGTSGGVSPSPTPGATAPTVSLELKNSANVTVTTISALDIFTLEATVKDSSGAALQGQIVNFSGDSTLVKFSGNGSGISLANGVASIQISPATGTSAGAGAITANVTVGGVAATQTTLGVMVTPLTASGAASAKLEMLNASSGTTSTISALETNTLRVTVKDASGNLLPAQAVTFSSSAGLVKFNPAASALTDIAGIATVSVTRNQATSAGADTISASVSVGGIPVTPATLNAYISPLVNGGLPTMTLGLRDAAMTSISTIPRSGSSYVRIQLLDATGFAPVPTLVTLSGNATVVSFNGTGLTDSTGVVLIPVTVVPTTAGGASTLRATANVPSTPGSTTTAATSASIDFLVPTGSTAGIPTLTVGLSGGGSTVAATGSTNAIATVKDAAGAAVAGKMVTFAGNAALIKFSPSSGQVLSDLSGMASIVVSPVSILSSGASTLTASTTIGTTALTTSFDFQLADSNVVLGNLSLGGALAAYGTRTVSVPVTNVGGGIPASPVQVTFAASCGTVTPAVATTDSFGIASSSYSANGTTGCAGTTVSISASATGAPTKTGTISVASANATNVQFISSTPQLIYLKDSVGPTQAQLVFKVVDALSNGLSNRPLSLSLSNNSTGVSINVLGNIAAVPLTSDSSGNVSVAVFSGTVPTSFTVKATLLDSSGNPMSVTASSNILTVAVGRPTQSSLSLSLEKFAIEAMNVDGQTTNVTLSLADRLGNPVPTGTQVNFVAESGVLIPPTCFTTSVSDAGGATTSQCTVKVRGQGTRTGNGRVAIMAYVAGEEDFVDVNGDNIYTLANDGANFTDLGRAYMDNMGGTGTVGMYDTGEFQVPRVGAAVCSQGAGCVGDGVWGAADVRTQATVVFASSSAVITSGSLIATTPVAGSSPVTNALTGLTVTIADTKGNSMPTGTKIDISAIDDGLQVPGYITGTSCTLSSGSSYTVANALGPVSLATSLRFCVAGDQLQVKVTSPLGTVTERLFSIQ